MATTVYGESDDLIEVNGDVRGEVGCYGTDERPHGVLLVFSDGTILEAKYGKGDMGVWGLATLCKGDKLKEITPCADEDARPHSDVAHFDDGVTWAYAAKEWERVS